MSELFLLPGPRNQGLDFRLTLALADHPHRPGEVQLQPLHRTPMTTTIAAVPKQKAKTMKMRLFKRERGVARRHENQIRLGSSIESMPEMHGIGCWLRDRHNRRLLIAL